MDGDVRIASSALTEDRAKRKFSCNLLLLPEWADRTTLEMMAERLRLSVCDLVPELGRYLSEDQEGRLTSSRLRRLLKEAGRKTGEPRVMVAGMDRALALLSPQDARSLLNEEGGGGLWQWQAGDGRFFLIPWLEPAKPPRWPSELSMSWEAGADRG